MTQATIDKMNARTAKKWAKKARKQTTSNPVQELKVSLLNVSEGAQGSASLPIWSQIMEAADNAGHFASDIVEKALEGKRISEKQAFVVAMFAKNNNLI